MEIEKKKKQPNGLGFENIHNEFGIFKLTPI
jgi:hypothetical protein